MTCIKDPAAIRALEPGYYLLHAEYGGNFDCIYDIPWTPVLYALLAVPILALFWWARKNSETEMCWDGEDMWWE